MDFNRFTEKLQEAVHAAQTLATRHGQQQLDVEHLLHRHGVARGIEIGQVPERIA